jgi:hypothetical protein
VEYWKDGKKLALATAGRDKQSLLAEMEMAAARSSSAQG